MVYEVQGKVFFVTGAANGIGAYFVRYAAEENAKHVAILDVSEENGVALEKELNDKYGANKAKFYKVDVTNEGELYTAYDSVVKDQGGIDVVVNNAGILNDSLNAYKTSIAINVTALISSSIKAMEVLSKGGTIINISSIAALHSSPIFPVYFSTKSAVLQFTRSLSMGTNNSDYNLRVITMCFGVTTTSLYENMGCINQKFTDSIPEKLKRYPKQKVETASRALLDTYKNANNGEVWLSTTEKPVRNITAEVDQAFGILTDLCF